MVVNTADKKYNEICEKLGCEPLQLSFDNLGDDADFIKNNPFSVLSIEEILYLYDNGYLGEPVTKK